MGKGAFGEVRLAIKKRTQIKYAIKRILKQTNSGSSLDTPNEQKKIKTEIDILASYTYVSNFYVFSKYFLYIILIIFYGQLNYVYFSLLS